MWFNRPKKRRNFFRQVQAGPYKAHRFKNPFFQTKTDYPKWPFIAVGIFIGLAVALTSFFFTSPIFAITAVRVEGVETISPTEIRTLVEEHLSERAFFIFNRANRFLFSDKEIKKRLEEKYLFSFLEIKREDKTLAIIFEEKVSSFLWRTGEFSYLVDQDGRIIRAASADEISALTSPPSLSGPAKDGGALPEEREILVFHDLADEPVDIGQTMFSKTEVENIQSFFEAEQAAGLRLLRFELNRAVGTWFRAVAADGFYILFDPNGDILSQADKAMKILREQISDPAKLEYIDVRFGDHVYYK